MTLPRILTHWHQANEVLNVTPDKGKVLEVGPGSGHTSWLLAQSRIDVTTLDIDPSIQPDLVGDVTKIPAPAMEYDCVLAAEVLEHIPFDDFEAALSELSRVSKKYIVITLPAPFVGVSAFINLPKFPPMSFCCGLPYRVSHEFDGQHYWELGKVGFSKRRIRRAFKRVGLDIVREFRPGGSLYCYFFVAKRTIPEEKR